MVRVRAWVIQYIYKSPHKDRSLCVCVCESVQNSLVDVFSDAAIKIPVLVRLN